jgi:DNA polymerase type B, organellar and viral
MRRPHYVAEDKGRDYPQQCIWFDTETHQKQVDEVTVSHHLTFGYACYMRRQRNGVWSDEDWCKFDTVDQFWDFVCGKARPKTKLYLFCHNTSFDLPVLDVFNRMPQRGFTIRSAIIDAPPTVIRLCRESVTIVILDTLNFWRMPLSYLGESIGLAKLDMPDNNDLTIEWDTYAKRDVEIIRASCLKWFGYLEKNDLGSFSNTLAGQSMRTYRHKFMKHKIFIDNNERSLKLTREGYYGGRVECFYIGALQQQVHALDVNSMYPAVMWENEFPIKLLSHTFYATVADIRLWLIRYAVCARVILRTSEPFAPIRRDGKLIFPTGTFSCILSSPELAYALTHAEILEVIEVAVFERALIFREYMQWGTDKKAKAKIDGDFVEEFNVKKHVNSFYGKWGQSGGKWQEEENVHDLSARKWVDYDVHTKKVTHYRQLGGLVQHKDEEEESRDSFPAIAAHVTAYARIKLWRLINEAGIENVYYCDTDCVLTNSVGRERLSQYIHAHYLGNIKVAGTYDEITQWGAKDYLWDTKAKHKGVKKKAEWLEPNVVRQQQWSGLKGIVSSGRLDAPTTKTIVKHLHRVYDKGVVCPDGRVTPHHLHHVKYPESPDVMPVQDYLPLPELRVARVLT